MNRLAGIRMLLAALMLCIAPTAFAQTFYELVYNDLAGNEAHGLMYYVDDTDCHLRLWTVDEDDTDERSLAAYDYITVKADEADEVNYTIMACDDDDAPILIWLWDTNESDERQMVPYISFDEDDDPDEWVRATAFAEVPLTYIDADYLNQFYSTDENFFRQVIAAHNEAVRTASEVEQCESGYSEIDTSTPTTTGASVSVSSRPTLHLFVVANTEVADIGSACRTDYGNITNEMKGVAQSLGIPLKEYNVTGSSYSKRGLEAALNRLHPAANDIVVFLYTGHGFRFDDQKDSFPMMAMTTNDYQPLDGNYVALSEVYQAICGKGARLNIVLSDCCNSQIGEVRPLQGSTLFSRGNNNFSRQRLADLFFNSKGSILSTAASPGEYSWCDAAGGMFTLSFIQSLRREISAMSTAPVSWQSVIDNTLRTALQRSRTSAEAQNGLKKMQVSRL